jgi:hypothetical protein
MMTIRTRREDYRVDFEIGDKAPGEQGFTFKTEKNHGADIIMNSVFRVES